MAGIARIGATWPRNELGEQKMSRGIVQSRAVLAPSPSTVSVVICSYRRRKRLLHTLQCIAEQVQSPLEVFVVDASPAGEQLGDSDINTLGLPVRYIKHPGLPNASAQRNRAIREARGELILFIDDDVDFDSTLLRGHVDAFRETGAEAISGLVLMPGDRVTDTPTNGRSGAIFDPGGPNYQACGFVTASHVICTANFCARRAALVDVGGFDEELRGTLDDVDLGVRLMRGGFLVVHHPIPRVLHYKDSGSGSRSSELGSDWELANRFYFQFRHYWKPGSYRLLALTLWCYCRPSRLWLKPWTILQRGRRVLSGYRMALQRIGKGPRFLEKTPAQVQCAAILPAEASDPA